MGGYTRKPLSPSRQKARQRAGAPNPSLLTEGQRSWRERVGIADLEAENARLQARVKKVEQELTYAALRVREARTERDGYKALAERRGEALKELADSVHIISEGYLRGPLNEREVAAVRQKVQAMEERARAALAPKLEADSVG